MDPDFDAEVARLFATIDPDARMAVLGPVIHQITDQLLTLGLFNGTGVAAVSNRVHGVTASNQGWNAADWDI